MQISKEAEYILNKLKENGYDSYIVGGCVRDYLLGKTPDDWDITTQAKPEDVKKIFSHTYDTGIQHGTVTVLIENIGFEVTTFRVESDYSDCRRPDSVSFTKNIEDDLSRRDFTINSIAYNYEKGFVDPFKGIKDIKSKIIKAVGKAEDRFKEDALRMMRAVRFSAQLNFDIERETFEAAEKNSHLIQNISIERIREEFTKILKSDYPEKISVLKNIGLLKYFFKELDNALDKKIKILDIISILPKETDILYGAIMAFSCPESAQTVMRRFKFDVKTIKTVTAISANIETNIILDEYYIRKASNNLTEDIFKKIILVKKAFYKTENNINEELKLKNILLLFENLKENNGLITLKNLAVNGKDIINLGVKNGLKVGFILDNLLDFVHRYPYKNNREILIEESKKLINKEV